MKRIFTEEHKRNLSIAIRKLYGRGFISPWKGKGYLQMGKDNPNYGNKWTNEQKLNMSLKKKGIKNPNISKIRKRLFKEGKLKVWNKGKKGLQKANKTSFKKGIHPNPKTEFTSEKMKRLWQNKESAENRIKTILKGLIKRPTSYEKIIINLINKYNLPYKYVGDGSFLIGFKNPDFINVNGEKICIEVYHNYFKVRDFGSIENYEKRRSEYFAKYGWKTIFINGDEVKLNNENVILKKFTDFIKGGI